ncbi:uncharacterized protein BT62DRAFT_1079604 [Guyanagaster necrorhizus]|uniref:Uncharacterized protein n=1 Tax=Guyanagaster necrorhizus TaxID=856835 RepID=A0A9P7VK62_9AGAR|nr:uncharacterized protein BT62DRAFT_1079604 [Guyanagaster necrorhizus MCA 3950]KAG7442073.1 hypothetical protein BT62DRAFT_1079604 [Guyanagaster necrorhizus MCA 3950]
MFAIAIATPAYQTKAHGATDSLWKVNAAWVYVFVRFRVDNGNVRMAQLNGLRKNGRLSEVDYAALTFFEEGTGPCIDNQPAIRDGYENEIVDAVYQAKSRVLNKTIQEIGMGMYHKQLFVCAGFGWFAFVARA